MIDLNTPLRQQLLEIPVREPVTQLPAHRQDDDLRRESEPLDRGNDALDRLRSGTVAGRLVLVP